ncbi:MAG: DUF533 domain-containing protein [Phycisphaerae bacterium]|nr:DUF533 domain-containing protein [Phycisphaerae bacterium]
MAIMQDNLNCLKNLLRLMCCDGKIEPQEKAFLARAAQELAVPVKNWRILLQTVLEDPVGCWPVDDHTKAAAALKAMIVMAKADGRVDEVEKQFVLQFAKAAGIRKEEWKRLLSEIDVANLFAPFQSPAKTLMILKEDFDNLDAFLKTACDSGLTVQTADVQGFLKAPAENDTIICFHASPDKDITLTRAVMLLEKTAPVLPVCILTRFQGHQVKYLHEAGVKTCIIEPVYPKDLYGILCA